VELSPETCRQMVSNARGRACEGVSGYVDVLDTANEAENGAGRAARGAFWRKRVGSGRSDGPTMDPSERLAVAAATHRPTRAGASTYVQGEKTGTRPLTRATRGRTGGKTRAARGGDGNGNVAGSQKWIVVGRPIRGAGCRQACQCKPCRMLRGGSGLNEARGEAKVAGISTAECRQIRRSTAIQGS
jgi:hypothetical protein